MGELANDLIQGYACSWCGTYFEKAHGYPVICSDCKENADDYDPDKHPPEATHSQL